MNTPEVDKKAASTAREAGNASYKKGKWAEAIGHYATAARLDPTDAAPLLNRAQAYIKLEKWQDVVRDCTIALSLPGQEKNVKALYRRALAKKEVHEESSAIEDLELVLRLEPKNAAAQEELNNIQSILNSRKEKKKKKTSSFLLDDEIDPRPSSSVLLNSASNPSSSSLTPKPKRFPASSIATSSSVTKSNEPTPEITGGKKIPIRIVDEFSPRPKSSSARDQGGASIHTSAHVDPSTPSSTSIGSSSMGVSGFVQKKGERAKRISGSVGGESKDLKSEDDTNGRRVVPEEPKKEQDKRTETNRTTGVKRAVSGLDVLDRLTLLKEESERWELITSIPQQTLIQWIDPLIEPDHLARIYETLFWRSRQDHEGREEANVLALGMKGMKRWRMVEGMLSRKERGWREAVEG